MWILCGASSRLWCGAWCGIDVEIIVEVACYLFIELPIIGFDMEHNVDYIVEFDVELNKELDVCLMRNFLYIVSVIL